VAGYANGWGPWAQTEDAARELRLAQNSVSGRILTQLARAAAKHNDAAPVEGGRFHHNHEVSTVKNCKLCKYSRICNDLPGICIWIPYLAVAVVAIAMGYLFVTQELL
jgi:hypothetical protein